MGLRRTAFLPLRMTPVPAHRNGKQFGILPDFASEYLQPALLPESLHKMLVILVAGRAMVPAVLKQTIFRVKVNLQMTIDTVAADVAAIALDKLFGGKHTETSST